VGEAEETDSPRPQDLDALARQADRFLSLLSGGVTPPREPEGSFLQRGDDQDVSVLRIVLGYGVPALLALGLSLLAFVGREL
jgi:hypothetical protein